MADLCAVMTTRAVGDNWLTADVADVSGAHLNDRAAVRGRKSGDRQRNSPPVVPVARRSMGRVPLRAQQRRRQFFGRGFAIATRNGNHGNF